MLKQTNEIGMAIPLLEGIDLNGKDITMDALLTQRRLARYLVEERAAHYHMTVKGNQPTLLGDLIECFTHRGEPEFIDEATLAHGRIETRRIWTTTALNDYLDFPHVGQAFLIERYVVHKKTGQASRELAYGLTSRSPAQAKPQRLLTINRGHWAIESCHYLLDWNYDEDRSRIRTGFGSENMTRLRRFAIGILKSRAVKNVAQKLRVLNRNIRLVFDYLCMTQNAQRAVFPLRL